MSATVLLGPGTAAQNSSPFVVRTDRWVTVFASGLGVETINIQISPDGGATWITITSGNFQPLTNTTNRRLIDSPGLYRLNKPSTSAASVTAWAFTEDTVTS